MLLHSPTAAFGSPAPAFTLSDSGGDPHALDQLMGAKGVLIAFICNHCPYVIEIMPRFVRDIALLQDAGINVVCINANDYHSYPADAPDRMPAFAAEFGLDAPYLIDEDQSVARAYGAVCTPDFFGYGAETGLQYRGRLDDAGMRGRADNRVPELVNAMRQIAETGQGPEQQTPAMGCSLKWK